MSGCDLCGDFPAEFRARCHPTAPLRVEKISETEVVLTCYLPTCNREVGRLVLAPDMDRRATAITTLCDRLDLIDRIAHDASLKPTERLRQISEWSGGFAKIPGVEA